MTGSERVIDITEYEFEEDSNLLETIKTGKSQHSKFGKILHGLLLRARFNSQRHYEIYAIAAEDDISDEDIKDMFNNSPQTAADTIRKLGVKIYSDRMTENEQVRIT